MPCWPVVWSREWLQSLWQWLGAGRHSLQPLAASGWPLLPIAGSQLVPLQPLARSAVVLPGADAWQPGLSEVLGKLGVHVLDSEGFELPLEMLRGNHLHSASGTGVAAALAAALGLSHQAQQQQQQSEHLLETVGRLTAAERRLLRSFLLQPTWFAAGTAAAPIAQLRAVARQLPLFELANSAPQQQQQQAVGAEDAATPAAPGFEPVFVSVEGNCCLAPAGAMHSSSCEAFTPFEASSERHCMPAGMHAHVSWKFAAFCCMHHTPSLAWVCALPSSSAAPPD